jgi:hypothetical protein
MTVVESKLRQGVLKFGEVGAQVEFGCQASSVIIASTYKEDGEAVEVLCGDTLPAATTVAKSLKLTAIQDFDNPAGLMRFLREHELQETPFTWQASPTAEVAVGTVQVRLGDWGGEVGKRLNTTPEMPIITLDWEPAPFTATGATAGTPGTWTPSGSTAPATLTELQAGAVAANPVTAWTTGQYAPLADASHVHWTSTAWAAGDAP